MHTHTNTNTHTQVFSEPSLASVASQESLIEVEHDIMSYLVDERLVKLEDAAQLIRSFNYLMLRICENSDKTALYGYAWSSGRGLLSGGCDGV